MSEGAARIAVLADTSLQRHVLQQALGASGYRVVLNNDPARMELADLDLTEADLWLVDLAQTEDSPLVDALLERDSTLVLFGEGHAPERSSENYPRWERRLFGKLTFGVDLVRNQVALDGVVDLAARRGRVGDEMERSGSEQRYGVQMTLTY